MMQEILTSFHDHLVADTASGQPLAGLVTAANIGIISGERAGAVARPSVLIWSPIAAGDPELDENPWAKKTMHIQVMAVAIRASSLETLQDGIDQAIEKAWHGGGLDTTNFVVAFVETSGQWTLLDTPAREVGANLEREVRAVKIYPVHAHRKGAF